MDLNAVELDPYANEDAIFSIWFEDKENSVDCLERNLSRKWPSVVISLYTESSRDFSKWFPAPELIMT